MKKTKSIKIISPFSLAMAILLDIAVITFTVMSVKKITTEVSLISVAFLVIMIFSDIIAILTGKEVVSPTVNFDDEKITFSSIDDNNVFKYSDIEKIECSKDTTASFKKNFIDRYSHIVFYMKDGNITTVDLGMTTLKTLNKITTEINNRI